MEGSRVLGDVEKNINFRGCKEERGESMRVEGEYREYGGTVCGGLLRRLLKIARHSSCLFRVVVKGS